MDAHAYLLQKSDMGVGRVSQTTLQTTHNRTTMLQVTMLPNKRRFLVFLTDLNLYWNSAMATARMVTEAAIPKRDDGNKTLASSTAIADVAKVTPNTRSTKMLIAGNDG